METKRCNEAEVTRRFKKTEKVAHSGQNMEHTMHVHKTVAAKKSVIAMVLWAIPIPHEN